MLVVSISARNFRCRCNFLSTARTSEARRLFAVQNVSHNAGAGSSDSQSASRAERLTSSKEGNHSLAEEGSEISCPAELTKTPCHRRIHPAVQRQCIPTA